MKRYGNLWNEIIVFGNLLSAGQQAQRGKRFRENVLEFNYNLEQELFQLQEELQSKIYCSGNYTKFQKQIHSQYPLLRRNSFQM
ncbi:hypothetical protein [Nostoc sp.]|uniref:hypothetical protein n=1 Tax=Nostoc sp. TaxID=1180 RepID=UPI003FA569B6